jgi:ABC-2 type transport system ATP-binding protein
MSGGLAVTVSGLSKSYGSLTAVDSISFSVGRGEIFGILGPNGAGKTTTLEMVEGLRRPDAGQILVEGVPTWPDPRRVKTLIGVQLQATALFDNLTVREMLGLFASFYDLYPSGEEVTALLDQVGLREKERSMVKQLSGGQQQRLSIVLALVNRPKVVFLDEPTTGLDPQARRRLWDVVRDINGGGMSVILTTHYMEEAEVLCDRVAIMDHGAIIAHGTPEELVRSLDASATIAFSSKPAFTAGTLEAISTVGSVEGQDEADGTRGRARYRLTTDDVEGTLFRLVGQAREQEVHLADLQVTGPTLEDVFLSMTGRAIRD